MRGRSSSALPLVVYHVGRAQEAVRLKHGGFADFFERLGGDRPLSWRHVDGLSAERFDVRDAAGIIVTGSATSMTQPELWVDAGLDVLDRAARSGTPVLGVCFGHQMIARMGGAAIAQNPQGWEAGTATVETTAHGSQDELFRGIPMRFCANQLHEDIVVPSSIGGDLVILASNEMTAVQAVAIGDSVRGVQFHPEFDGAITQSYLAARREVLGEAANSQPRDCPQAVAIFQNFIDYFALRA